MSIFVTLLSGTQDEFISFLTKKADIQRDLAEHSRTQRDKAAHLAHAAGLDDAARYVGSWEITGINPPPTSGVTIAEEVEWRIMPKKPRARKWIYLAFTGATSADKDRIEASLARVRGEAKPGWEFRLEHRKVITLMEPWREEAINA